MTRKVEEIKRIKTESGTVESHPAFGCAVFHKRQGSSGKLYGSSLPDHQNTISLTISTSERNHHLYSDRHYPKTRLIEVEFSVAQFAELLTTMNEYSGVPCTIRRHEGKFVSEIPDTEVTESDRIETEFKEELEDRVAEMKDVENKISDILDKKSIGKSDRKTIKDLVYQARRFLIDSAPFAVSSMVEAKEKVVSSAKAEIDAFMTSTIQSMGKKALQDNSEDTEVPALPECNEQECAVDLITEKEKVDKIGIDIYHLREGERGVIEYGCDDCRGSLSGCEDCRPDGTSQKPLGHARLETLDEVVDRIRAYYIDSYNYPLDRELLHAWVHRGYCLDYIKDRGN